MIFTCEEKHNPWNHGDKARYQFIKDDQGYIVGSAPMQRRRLGLAEL